jgi:hypothetical protein
MIESLYLVFRIFVVLSVISLTVAFLGFVKRFVDNYEFRRNQREWKHDEWEYRVDDDE